MKVAGAGYEEITRAGGGIRSSARALAGATDERGARPGAGAGRRDARARHDDVRVEVRLRPVARGRAARAAPGPRAGRTDGRRRSTSTALLAHVVPEGFDADGWMDVVEEMLPEVAAIPEVQALDLYVESVAFTNEHLRRMGALAARARARPARPCRAVQLERRPCPSRSRRARAPSTTSRACPTSTSGRSPPRSARPCCCRAPSSWAGEHTAPGRALADAGAIGVLATDLNPGTSPIASLPLIAGLAVRRYGWTAREALLALTLNAAWVLRRSEVTGSLEVGQARRRRRPRRAGRARALPPRPRPRASPSSSAASSCHVRPGAEHRVRR